MTRTAFAVRVCGLLTLVHACEPLPVTGMDLLTTSLLGKPVASNGASASPITLDSLLDKNSIIWLDESEEANPAFDPVAKSARQREIKERSRATHVSRQAVELLRAQSKRKRELPVLIERDRVSGLQIGTNIGSGSTHRTKLLVGICVLCSIVSLTVLVLLYILRRQRVRGDSWWSHGDAHEERHTALPKVDYSRKPTRSFDPKPQWRHSVDDGPAAIKAKLPLYDATERAERPAFLDTEKRLGDLTNQVNVNELWAAVLTNDTSVALRCLGAGADPNLSPAEGHETMLMAAAARGHFAITAALIDAGADVNAVRTLDGSSALMAAAAKGHAAV